ncbi:hypothetical protein GWK47_001788 [Chionoecetes opilio]|uniref:Uncharacterized protein n=1 Tax=Chionoecetes opilio TaxID=41210 RepID=A0A8J4Y2R7_CHIOP|nr:hypothetical protein GWK47_001788 [Chionoecetes opilio]
MEGGHPPYCDDCLVPLTGAAFAGRVPSLGDLRVQFLSRCRGFGTVLTVSPWHWERGVSLRDMKSIHLLRRLAFSTSYDLEKWLILVTTGGGYHQLWGDYHKPGREAKSGFPEF